MRFCALTCEQNAQIKCSCGFPLFIIKCILVFNCVIVGFAFYCYSLILCQIVCNALAIMSVWMGYVNRRRTSYRSCDASLMKVRAGVLVWVWYYFFSWCRHVVFVVTKSICICNHIFWKLKKVLLTFPNYDSLNSVNNIF